MNQYPPGKKVGFYRPNALGARMLTNFDNLELNEKTGELEPMLSMTKQSEMDACDINNILKQYSPAGLQQLISENAARGQYADLPDEIDYQTSLNTVIAAQASFGTLPAKVRERFLNDPARFLEFLSRPENAQEAVDLGLATLVSLDKEPETAPIEPTGGAGG